MSADFRAAQLEAMLSLDHDDEGHGERLRAIAELSPEDVGLEVEEEIEEAFDEEDWGSPAAEAWLLEATGAGAGHKVGDKWQGPSGRWFTINAKGRCVPAAGPAKARPEKPKKFSPDEAHAHIEGLKKGPVTAGHLVDAKALLATMTKEECRELNRRLKTRASAAPNKAALVAAIVDRALKGEPVKKSPAKAKAKPDKPAPKKAEKAPAPVAAPAQPPAPHPRAATLLASTDPVQRVSDWKIGALASIAGQHDTLPAAVSAAKAAGILTLPTAEAITRGEVSGTSGADAYYGRLLAKAYQGGEKEEKPAPAKPAEAGKPKAGPAPKKPSAEPMPKDKAEATILKGMIALDPEVKTGSTVLLRDLRKKMPPELQTRPAFDNAIIALAEEGKVVLHRHDQPSMLTPEQREELVYDPTGWSREDVGNYYTSIALRVDWKPENESDWAGPEEEPEAQPAAKAPGKPSPADLSTLGKHLGDRPAGRPVSLADLKDATGWDQGKLHAAIQHLRQEGAVSGVAIEGGQSKTSQREREVAIVDPDNPKDRIGSVVVKDAAKLKTMMGGEKNPTPALASSSDDRYDASGGEKRTPENQPMEALKHLWSKSSGGRSIRGYVAATEIPEADRAALQSAGYLTPEMRRGKPTGNLLVDTDKVRATLDGPAKGPTVPTGPVSRSEAASHIAAHLEHAGITATPWTGGNAHRVYITDAKGKLGYLAITHEGKVEAHLDRRKGEIMGAVPDLHITPHVDPLAGLPKGQPEGPRDEDEEAFEKSARHLGRQEGARELG